MDHYIEEWLYYNFAAFFEGGGVTLGAIPGGRGCHRPIAVGVRKLK